MKAAWYEKVGQAAEVLKVGEMPMPEIGAGEVRVRVRASGINPADIKPRAGWGGLPMMGTQVIPHCDGAGVATVLCSPSQKSNDSHVGSLCHAESCSPKSN